MKSQPKRIYPQSTIGKISTIAAYILVVWILYKIFHSGIYKYLDQVLKNYFRVENESIITASTVAAFGIPVNILFGALLEGGFANYFKKWPLFMSISTWVGIAIFGFAATYYLLFGESFFFRRESVNFTEDTKTILGIIGSIGAVGYLVIKYQERQAEERKEKREEDQVKNNELRAAIDLLGSETPSTRIAGVYALAEFADKYHEDSRQKVVNILCGYLRTKRPEDDGPVEATIIDQIHNRTQDPTRATSWSRCYFNFRKAIFLGPVSFTESNFMGSAIFVGSIFNNEAYFDRAKFKFVTYFDKSTFYKEAYFSGAEFKKGIDFNGSIFINGASFTRAKSIPDISLKETILGGSINFSSTVIEEINLDGAKRLPSAKLIGEPSFPEDALEIPTSRIDNYVALQKAWSNLDLVQMKSKALSRRIGPRQRQ